MDSGLKFLLWVRFYSNYRRFQAGKYRFEAAISPASVAKKFLQGDIYAPIVLQFTIPEGFVFRQVADRLVSQGIGSREEFARLFVDAEFLSSLDVNCRSLEGYIFPATYRFTVVPSAREVLAETVNTFFEKLPAEYATRAQAMGLALTQAVTFASLIEAETPHHDEKPLIAEVIWRRLREKTPLGVDAAIIYGIKDYDGNISRRHLEDKSNPYNTRVHFGLPPTPICSPSTQSLEAVLAPTDNGYGYFVLDPATDRRHHFSTTFAEHSKYVRDLVQAVQKKRSAPEGMQGKEQPDNN